MTGASVSRDVRNCILFSHTVSALAVLVGSLALLGWALGISVLTSVRPDFVTMKPNSAICFLLAGLSLWLIQLQWGERTSPRRHRIQVARSVGGIVGLTGILTFAEYVFHLNLDIDEILFSKTLLATGIVHPGRMAGATALGFLFLGGGLLLATTSNVYLSQSIGLLAALDGCVACIGYLLGAPSLYAVSAYSSMAPHTALLFLLMGLAIVAARPEAGLMAVVTSGSLGGVIVRRVLPVIIFFVLLLGWLSRQTQVAGHYPRDLGIALLILAEVVAFVMLLWFSGMRLDRLDQERGRAESRNLLLSAIVESSEDAILSKDLSGTITSWNQGAERLYGYSAAEIVGKPMATLIPDELREEAANMLRRIAGGQLVTAEDTIRRRKDGGLVHVSLVISPVRDQGGQIAGASAIAHDISQRKRAEDELRASEDRYRDLVEHSQDLLCTHDLSGKLLSANQAPAKVLGYDVAELLKIPMREIIVPEYREEFDQYLARIEKNGADKGLMVVQTRTGERRTWAYDNTLRTEGVSSPVVRGMAHDITERRRAELAERESEARLRLSVQSANVGLWDWNLITNEVYYSPEWKSQIGYEDDEISNRFEEWQNRVHPDDLDGVIQKVGAFLANPQGRYEVEFRLRHKTGSYRWIYAQADVLRDGAGKPVRMLGCHLDITERKRAEKELRESEASLKEAQRIAHLGSYVIDFASETWKGSEVLDELLGIDAAWDRSLAGWLALVHPDDRARMAHYAEIEVIGRTGTFDQEYRIIRPADGAERWLWGRATLEKDGKGRAVRMTGSSMDITDQKLAEEALRKSEERFSKAFRSNPLALSLSAKADGRYLDVNDAFLSMLGYERKDVIGRTAAEIRFWNEPSDRMEMLRQLSDRKRVAKHHTRYRTAKGEIREAEVWAESIELDGQACVLGITRDITEVKQLEEQFRQAQKMEAVGRLAGGVAHDFNNLLAVILGYSDMSLSEMPPESRATHYMTEAKKATHRATLLTQQLLAFSRKQVVFPKVLDLNDVVHSATKMFLRLVGEDIAIEFRPTIPLGNVKIDPGQIEQVLMNLVVNARDAMPSGGKIIIETAEVEVDEHYVAQHPGSRAGPYVVLVVSDTGCGMDEATKSQIFEPFFTTKELGKGTGLGLSTVYGIVKQSEGYIDVYSELGAGTMFRVYFPLVREESTKLALPDEEGELPRGSETILVVEDEESMREVTVQLLRRGGYQVLEVTNAEEALEIVKSETKIDLLLTDVIMPGKSGAELAKDARTRHPKLAVLFMSGYTGDLVIRQGIALDERSFLEKPFTRRSLLTKVHSALHCDS